MAVKRGRSRVKRLFLFGDSITAGYYEQEITDRLTCRLQKALPTIEVVNAGIPGDTTADGLGRLEQFILRHDPEFVTLFFGANDVALYRLMSAEQYGNNLRSLVEQIGPEKVILISGPYTSQRNRKIDRPLSRIEKFVTVASEVGEAYDLPFINLLDEMLRMDNVEDLLQEDGLHFSEEGYDFLAERMLPVIHQLIVEKE